MICWKRGWGGKRRKRLRSWRVGNVAEPMILLPSRPSSFSSGSGQTRIYFRLLSKSNLNVSGRRSPTIVPLHFSKRSNRVSGRDKDLKTWKQKSLERLGGRGRRIVIKVPGWAVSVVYGKLEADDYYAYNKEISHSVLGPIGRPGRPTVNSQKQILTIVLATLKVDFSVLSNSYFTFPESLPYAIGDW